MVFVDETFTMDNGMLYSLRRDQYYSIFNYVQSSFKAAEHAELGQIHLSLFQTHPKPKSDA